MEPQNPTVPTVPTPPPQVTLPAISPVFPKKNNLAVILLSILLLVTLSATVYLFLRVQSLTKQLAQIQIKPTPTPLSTEIPSPTPNPTANWKTYTNTVQKISFKYPSTWVLDSNGDQEQLNAQLILTKDQAKIKMYFNMNGIGGQGQTYEGQPFSLDGNSLYRFVKTNSYDNTQMVGISTSLTNTLGVFEVNGKTYSITLSYPVSDAQKAKGISLEEEFDQILSTFKFTN